MLRRLLQQNHHTPPTVLSASQRLSPILITARHQSSTSAPTTPPQPQLTAQKQLRYARAKTLVEKAYTNRLAKHTASIATTASSTTTAMPAAPTLNTDPNFMPTSLTPSEAEQLLKEVDYVLFDVDGVIWSGDHVFYQVPETLYWLAKDMGKKVRFMTNNATRTRVATKDEFIHKGIHFVTEDMIYSSAYVAALELKNRWAERRESETNASLAKVPNPFGVDGTAANETTAVQPSLGGSSPNAKESSTSASALSEKERDAIEASVMARQESIARLESDRFPYNVFVIGEKGLHDELREVALAPDAMTVGLELVPNASSEYPLLRSVNYPNILKAMKEDMIPVGVRVIGCGASPSTTRLESIESLDCGAVIVGLDRNVSMLKTALASLVLQRSAKYAGSGKATLCDFIATNEDPSITIGEEGYHFPGAGSCVAMLKMASGMEPTFVCGKPEQLMAKVFLENEKVLDPSRCLMIGDRLTTDIAFGRGMGARTLMVLTGAETLKDVAAAPSEIRPEFVAPSAASLMYVNNNDY